MHAAADTARSGRTLCRPRPNGLSHRDAGLRKRDCGQFAFGGSYDQHRSLPCSFRERETGRLETILDKSASTELFEENIQGKNTKITQYSTTNATQQQGAHPRTRMLSCNNLAVLIVPHRLCWKHAPAHHHTTQDVFPSLGYCGNHQELSASGYSCPRCKTKTSELPSECVICALPLVRRSRRAPQRARRCHGLCFNQAIERRMSPE